jgi:signal transduction histidine kinase
MNPRISSSGPALIALRVQCVAVECPGDGDGANTVIPVVYSEAPDVPVIEAGAKAARIIDALGASYEKVNRLVPVCHLNRSPRQLPLRRLQSSLRAGRNPPLPGSVQHTVKRLGFRSRLFLILALFAIVPSVVLTVAWGGMVSRLLPLMSGSAAWDRAAATGKPALAIARRSAHTAAEDSLIAAHERELQGSVTQALRFDYLTRQFVPVVLVTGLIALAVLMALASNLAGHLSRQASRPLDELVGWTQRIRRGEPLPPDSQSRGAPEFGVLRDRMREMADALESGRRAAIDAERLEAFRESARQVAHELKNPLTPIRFAVARLQRGVGPELQETVEVLAIESARLEAMARSFAQFGKLTEGPPSEIDVGDLVREAVRTTVPAEMVCEVIVDAGVPELFGVHDALGRAITNVLLNAVEASHATGTLGVRVTSSAEREIIVAIRDHGIGIAPERLATIWTPYVTDKTGGTGLGLAIVKQTVVAHGGRVEATSTVGEGTEIRLIFPAAPQSGLGHLSTGTTA